MAERRHDDARGDQREQHLARHLHGAAAPFHARQGRDYSDLILGLPGETYESFVKGVDQLIENGQHKPHPVQQPVDPAQRRDGRAAYQAKYGMVTVESRSSHPRRAHRAR